MRLTGTTMRDVRGVCKVQIEPAFHNIAKSDTARPAVDELTFNAASLPQRCRRVIFFCSDPTAAAGGI